MSSSCCCSCSCSANSAEKEVRKALDTWVAAVASGSAEAVTKLYVTDVDDLDDAVLLPTLSGVICDTHPKRLDYFKHFTAKFPQGKIDEVHTRVLGNVAINSGHYTFTFKDGTSAAARFSFVYAKTLQGWMIVDHHSSLVPAGH
ncbi:MAG: DUF4440 domain-containing protein [Alphaproteobacteria bacterium]|nr:DUF4440 domain-containing protein [Alphaproteobacteria bacterium]